MIDKVQKKKNVTTSNILAFYRTSYSVGIFLNMSVNNRALTSTLRIPKISYVYLVSGVKYSLLLQKLAVVNIVTCPAHLFSRG